MRRNHIDASQLELNEKVVSHKKIKNKKII